MLQDTITIRVRYPEVDAMGYLHHSRFLQYFEMGRIELLRKLGHHYGDLERQGIIFVVAKIECRYKAPARYDEELSLTTRVVRQTHVRIDHVYELKRGDTLLAEASSTIACVDRNGQLQQIPGKLGEEIADQTRTAGGTAQHSLVTWAANEEGARTLEQAIAIARSHGVWIPDDVAFYIDESLGKDVAAQYFGAYVSTTAPLLRSTAVPAVFSAERHRRDACATRKWRCSVRLGQTILWHQFYNRFNRIPVKLRPDVLSSDEAIVAVLTHEFHELNRLRELFSADGGQMRAETLHDLTAPGLKGNLHDQAWDLANNAVARMRGGK